jgi:hypothetical protein
VEATVKLTLEVPDPVMDVGLKPTVTPVGWPEALRAIDELNPPEAVVVTVDVPTAPCATETEDGEAEMVNVGVCAFVTVSETEVF